MTEKPRVTVIDDSQSDLVMARLVLKREGCEPTLYENPVTALDEMPRSKPDLILLDIEMPGLSGLDVLKRIRRNAGLREVPVIMLTGRSGIEDVTVAVRAGAQDYVVKPIDPEIFANKMWKLIGALRGEQKSAEWVEFQIHTEADRHVEVTLPTEIISIGETSLTLRMSHGLPVGTPLWIRPPFLAELEIPVLPVTVRASEEREDFHEIRCTLVGLAPKDLQKIRLYCKTLWRSQR